MKTPLYTIMLTLCVGLTAHAQELSWRPYSETDGLSVSVRYADCHYPEKGIDSRYLFIRLENTTSSPMEVSYVLDRAYNDRPTSTDLSTFSFVVPAYGALEAGCADLRMGLHLYSKTLGLEAKSVLTSFGLSELVINGKNTGK